MGRKPLRYDCIIVGAGISGLSCAKEISAAGLMVLLLESSTRIGGRIKTIDLGGDSDTPADMGASFVHGIIDNPLTKLSQEVPFKLHLPTERTTTRVYPYKAHGEPLKEEVSEKLDFLSFNVTFNRCHEQAQAGPSVPKEEDSVWDALSSTPAGQGVWRGIEEEDRERVLSLSPMWSGWTGAKLSDVSLKWWGFEDEFRGEDAVVSNGYRQLVDWTLLQAQRQGAELICDSKVTKISRQENDGPFSVLATSSDGTKVEFEADHVVCSVSLGVLQKDPPIFEPPLPPRKLQSINRLGMGLLNKILLKYEDAWWRAGLPPKQDGGWLYLLPKSLSPEKVGADLKPGEDPLEMFREVPLIAQDYFPINGQPMLMLFVGPPTADALEALSPEQEKKLIALIHKRLMDAVRFIDQEDPGFPTSYAVSRWREDSNTHGSYSFLPARDEARGIEGGSPLDMTELGRPLLDGKLGFCGEATHPDCYASVHGALMTGTKEGRRVVLRIKEAKGAQEEP